MLKFGTLGTANITPRALLAPCNDEPQAAVHCIAARDRDRAEGFARWHNIPVVHDNYLDVVNDPEIDAVYIPLPISHHHEWTMTALQAGKHVLCEKSLASNADEAAEMAAAAHNADRVLLDAFHYRYHPVFERAKAVVQSGALGTVQTIDATFHVPIPDPDNIRLIYATGGGVTMDIGCYPISWIRHLTGEEPDVVSATAEVGPEHVDTYLTADFRFPSGIQATISGDMRPQTELQAEFTVTGDDGTLHVDGPLAPQLGHEIQLEVGGERSVERLDRRPSYAYQLDAFLAAVTDGAPLATDGQDGERQMSVIDRCYEAAGLPRRGLDL